MGSPGLSIRLSISPSSTGPQREIKKVTVQCCNLKYSGTSANDHCPFWKDGQYPKCSVSENFFPLKNKVIYLFQELNDSLKKKF